MPGTQLLTLCFVIFVCYCLLLNFLNFIKKVNLIFHTLELIIVKKHMNVHFRYSVPLKFRLSPCEVLRFLCYHVFPMI